MSTGTGSIPGATADRCGERNKEVAFIQQLLLSKGEKHPVGTREPRARALGGSSEQPDHRKKIANQLPIKWDADAVRVGGKTFDAKSHTLIIVYPNPLKPRRHVVLNSSFTFREYVYLNNARQVPKLPDWAIIDRSGLPGTQRPGRVVEAGFFG